MDVTFNIKVTMKDRWVNDFCSMLDEMQRCGSKGHSAVIGFFSDGDGDFRPTFEIDRPYMRTDGYRKDNIPEDGELPRVEVIFDAG